MLIGPYAEDPGRPLVELQSMSEDLRTRRGRVQGQERGTTQLKSGVNSPFVRLFVLFRPSGDCMPTALGKVIFTSLIIL